MCVWREWACLVAPRGPLPPLQAPRPRQLSTPCLLRFALLQAQKKAKSE